MDAVDVTYPNDPRPDMEFEVGYQADGVVRCTYGPESGDRFTVTKHYWANRPLGQLNTRCPDHQAKWEQATA